MAIACVVAVTSVLSRPLDAQTSTTLAERIALFVRYVEPLRLQAGIPGLSAAVVVNGRIVWEQGFGFADVDGRVAATPDTPYRIASLTKTFSSVLLMQCVQAGTLSLDTPIRTYTSGVPDAAATVRHVVSMTSDAPPGSRYRYDGDRFATLTSVVQACTSEPYRIALASRILNRVGMIDSVPGQDRDVDGECDLVSDCRVGPRSCVPTFQAVPALRASVSTMRSAHSHRSRPLRRETSAEA